MRQKLLSTISIMFAGILLTGCGMNHHAWVNEQEAGVWAEEVVTLLHREEYHTIAERHVLGHTAEELEAELGPILRELGALVGFTKYRYASGSADGTEYLTVYLTAAHTNKTAKYTITFWQDGSIAGLLIA